MIRQDTRATNFGFSSEQDEVDSLPIPPSRASSATCREFPLPGYIEENQELDDGTPPPSYVACTIPPPVYDELYPATEVPAPKHPETNDFRRKWIKYIFCIGYAILATTLLVIGIKNTVTQTCEERMFLLIWCISTGILIYIGLLFALSKKLRKKIERFKTVSPILLYTISVFSVSWVIGGAVSSWDQLDENHCDGEVVRAVFASCIIGFVSAIAYCCFGITS